MHPTASGLPTWAGFVFLAVVVDAFSRRVVGWQVADHLRTELAIEALNMALWQRRPPQRPGQPIYVVRLRQTLPRGVKRQFYGRRHIGYRKLSACFLISALPMVWLMARRLDRAQAG